MGNQKNARKLRLVLTATSTEAADSNTSTEASTASEGQAPAVTSSSDNDDDESLPEPHKISMTPKKAAKGHKRKKAVEKDTDDECEAAAELPKKVVLLIPQVSSDCIQRVSIDSDIPFDDVLATIYETLSCSDIPRKPNLSYKLDSAPSKAPAISLSTSDDWDGCLETLTNAESTKKKRTGKAPTIPININVPADYMHSLRTQKKNGKKGASAKSTSTRTSKSRKPQPQLLNLDEDEDDLGTDEDEDGELPERERKHLGALKNKLASCARCGPNQFCKIDKSGNHVKLTMNQHSAWALGSHGVTLQNPPKNDLFACFHKSQNVHSTPDPVNLVSGYTFPAFPPPWASMYDPRMFISQAPPGYASSLPPSDLQRDHP